MRNINKGLGYLAIAAISVAIIYFTGGSTAGCWGAALFALIGFDTIS